MNTITPQIAIILLNYNGYDETVDCVRSLLCSTYNYYSIIIVDNNSPDRSGKKLKNLYEANSKINVLLNTENKGFSAGNNVGIKYALEKGYDAILLINNDTVVASDFLQILVNETTDFDQFAIYTCKIKYYYDTDLIWYAGGDYSFVKGSAYHFGAMELDDGRFDSSIDVGFICGCCMYMSSKVIERIGLLPEEYFLYSEDLDYSLNARNNNIRLHYIPGAVIYHKVSASSSKISNISQFYIIRNRFYLIRKYHHGITRISAILYTYLWCVKRILLGNFDLKTCYQAICSSFSMRGY